MEQPSGICSNVVSTSLPAGNEKVSYTIFAAKVDDIATDIIINSYCDRYVIVITQFRKLGTLVSVEKDSTQVEGETKEIYNIRVLLGPDREDVHAAARFLAEQLNLCKPTIFSFALRDLSPPVLRALCLLIKGKL